MAPNSPAAGLAGASSTHLHPPAHPPTAASGTLLAPFICRLDHDTEEGEVILPPISGPDWTGKRPYLTTDGVTVYLFPDEVHEDDAIFVCVHGCPIVIDPSEIAEHAEWHQDAR